MKIKNKIILLGLITLSPIILGMKSLDKAPNTYYRVYLNNKNLGLIKSKESLESYIDKKQNSLKEQYGVSTIYAPEGLKIVKEITYSNDYQSTKTIYNKIKKESSFTIDGYKITIRPYNSSDKKENPLIIYTINKKVFTESVDKTVKSFVTDEDYKIYSSGKKQTIDDVGKIIKKIYIGNKISIKKSKISTNNKIYTSTNSLSKYLLFGGNDNESKYVTKEGDTISDVAYNNKMAPEEFLIINPNFKDANALLYPGQTVNIGTLSPRISIVEEDKVVAYQEKKYQTETRNDNSKLVSYSEVIQKGVDGKDKVTQEVQKVNGETTNIVPISTEEVTPAITEIVVKGTQGSGYGNVTSGYGNVLATRGEWGWPATCASISSPFGYRWGTLHDGTDIAGCGYGSNIFAAMEGTVVKVSYKYDNGKYIVIQHPNGFYTMYAHLSGYNVQEGQRVSKGQVIGYMGQTGFAKGVHLHYSIWYGYPYYGGKVYNAMSFY